MTESQFIALVDACLTRVEDALEASGLDHDCSRTGKVLTVELNDASQVVINAQAAVLELWLASKRGAYHFKWDGQRWIDSRSGLDFAHLLSRDISAITGQAVVLKV